MKRREYAGLVAAAAVVGVMIGLEAHVNKNTASAYGSYVSASSALTFQVAQTPRLVMQLDQVRREWTALHDAATNALHGLHMLRAEVGRSDAAAGLTTEKGAGITVTVAFDPHLPLIRGLRYVDEAVQLQMLVNWLQAAGARALAVSGQRLVTTSSIRTVGGLTSSVGPFSGVVQVNEVPVKAPYVISALGSAQAMMNILQVEDLAQQFNILDQSFQVRRYSAGHPLVIPAYRGALPGKYAREVAF